MGHLRWSIGDVRVTCFVESELPFAAQKLLPQATPEALAPYHSWLRPHFVTDADELILSIHGLVVESEGVRILVDTCVGDHRTPGFESLTPEASSFLSDLEVAGFPPSEIDFVLCTHLHFDHVGLNTVLRDGVRVPSFPGARYLFARAEWEHWRKQPASVFTQCLEESVVPIFDAGLVELVETDHRITGEVALDPTPGHTPGHVAVRIASRGREARITGDLTHHPVQWAEPAWRMPADVDPEAAIETRRRYISEHVNRPVLIIGTHYAAPSAGYLVSDGTGCHFEIEEPVDPSETRTG